MNFLSLIIIPLGAFLSAGIGFLAIKALLALGIGFITYQGVDLALGQLFSAAQGHYNNIPSFALQIAGLGGLGQAFGMISGAITFRMTFVLMKRLGVIPN